VNWFLKKWTFYRVLLTYKYVLKLLTIACLFRSISSGLSNLPAGVGSDSNLASKLIRIAISEKLLLKIALRADRLHKTLYNLCTYTAAAYLSPQHTVIITYTEDTGFFENNYTASIPELGADSFVATGFSPRQAAKRLRKVQKALFKQYVQKGTAIPTPKAHSVQEIQFLIKKESL